MSKKIIKEAMKEKIKNDPWRLSYHLMPETGWLNDPNGAVQKDGVFHIYHQYVPEDATGGKTHWGHKTSTDLVHFTEEEIFLSPEMPFDQDGVYSGSAIVKDNQIHFFYTGNVKELDGEYIHYGRKQHTVHVVSDDGFNVLKREVVIHHDDYPEGFTTHIRDPKVFDKNGQYYMILGARKADNTGAMLTYQSTDLEKWEYIGNFIEGQEDEGFMFECPDFFETEETNVLIMSPQGIQPQGFQYQGQYQAGYLLGDVNWETVQFEAKTNFKELDRGFDFYAPQSFTDEEGNQILWGWMGMADSSPEFINPTVKNGWQHALTMPRVLTVESDKLKQRPHPAYEMLRRNEERGRTKVLNEPFSELTGEIYELKLTFLDKTNHFTMSLRQDTRITYKNGILTLSHGYSGFGRRKRQIQLDELNELRIFSDSSSIELFVNDGAYVMTSRVYPEKDSTQISFLADKKIRYEKWDLVMSK